MLEVMQLSEPQSSTGDVDHEENVILRKITAYLSPIRLTDDEKLSPLTFWKKQCDVYPNVSVLLARIKFLITPHASSAPVKGLFSSSGLTKNSRRSAIAPTDLKAVFCPQL